MISRLVKVITNKPTQIERPVFLKHFKKENKQIKELEELLKTCNENSRKFIEQDIKNLKYGQIGENNVYYELKNSFIPMICLHDIRLKYRGKVAQIDFLIITSKYIYVIECKNLAGDITITDEGEFIRSFKNSYGKVISKEGMYSPIVQNERHINIIKEILNNEFKYKYKLKRIESLVVVSNPKTIINKKYAPKCISDKIIRYDQIIDKIKSHQNDKKIDWVFIEEDMRNIAKCLLKFHKEVNIDYNKKYSLDENNNTKIKNYAKSVHIPEEKVIIRNDEDLRKSLKSYRFDRSKKEGVKAYMIFSNETMEELIEKRPKNLNELRNIKGFGPVKTEKYGRDLIDIIS